MVELLAGYVFENEYLNQAYTRKYAVKTTASIPAPGIGTL